MDRNSILYKQVQSIYRHWETAGQAEWAARNAYAQSSEYKYVVANHAPNSIYNIMALEAQMRAYAALQKTILALNQNDHVMTCIFANETIAAVQVVVACADRVSDWTTDFNSDSDRTTDSEPIT